MSSKTNSKTARRPLTRMTAAELADATKRAEINFDDTRPLPPQMAAAWDRAKRGRPRIGEGAEKVLISMERRLLLVTDSLARRKGLDRSKLIAMAIREMLEREAAGKKPTPDADELTEPWNASMHPTAGSRASSRKRTRVGAAGSPGEQLRAGTNKRHANH